MQSAKNRIEEVFDDPNMKMMIEEIAVARFGVRIDSLIDYEFVDVYELFNSIPILNSSLGMALDGNVPELRRVDSIYIATENLLVKDFIYQSLLALGSNTMVSSIRWNTISNSEKDKMIYNSIYENSYVDTSNLELPYRKETIKRVKENIFFGKYEFLVRNGFGMLNHLLNTDSIRTYDFQQVRDLR